MTRRFILPLALAAAMLLSMLGWAVAQGAGAPVKVLVDKDHNALITVDREESESSKGGGSIHAGVDLATGLATYKVEADLKDATGGQTAGGNLSIYSEATDKSGLFLADFKLPLPGDAKVNVTADGKIQVGNNVMHADVKADATFPNPKPGQAPPFTGATLEGTNHTDYKSFKANVKFSAAAPNLQQMVPVKDAKITVSETAAKKEGSDAVEVSTTLVVEATVDARSQPGQMIAQIKANPKMIADMMKQKLSAAGVQVESVEVTKADVQGDNASFALTIKAKGLRDVITNFAGMFLGNIPNVDPKMLADALKSMLQIQFEKLEIAAKVDNGVTGSVDVSGNNIDKFMEGYMKVMSVVQEQALAEQRKKAAGNKSAEFFFKWQAAVQKKVNELNAASFKAMVAAGAAADQTFNLNLEMKDNNVSVKAALKSDTTNADKVMEELKKVGMPTLDRLGALFNVKTEGNLVSGTIYGVSAGPWLDAVKSILVAPAQQDPDLKPTADLVANLQLKDLKMSGELKDQKLTLNGYLETSDLTPAAKAALAQAAPNVTGTLDGGRLDVTSAEGKSKTNAKLHFKEFMSGKADADVKTAVSDLLGGAPVEVSMNADAGQVALAPALSKPEVAMPAALAAVKSTGDSTLFPGGPLAGAPGLPGGNTGMIIAIAAGALVLIGLLVAMTKKKA